MMYRIPAVVAAALCSRIVSSFPDNRTGPRSPRLSPSERPDKGRRSPPSLPPCPARPGRKLTLSPLALASSQRTRRPVIPLADGHRSMSLDRNERTHMPQTGRRSPTQSPPAARPSRRAVGRRRVRALGRAIQGGSPLLGGGPVSRTTTPRTEHGGQRGQGGPDEPGGRTCRHRGRRARAEGVVG